MQVHSLEFDDFSDDNYVLIGIHTVLEESKLAYSLNQNLKTKFKRASYNLDFENRNNNASFSIYEFLNSKFSHNWFLISNTYKYKSDHQQIGLFRNEEIITYLIPEKKKVDFFLKLEGDFEQKFIDELVETMNHLNQVITTYTIDPNKLKSKDFLIF